MRRVSMLCYYTFGCFLLQKLQEIVLQSEPGFFGAPCILSIIVSTTSESIFPVVIIVLNIGNWVFHLITNFSSYSLLTC